MVVPLETSRLLLRPLEIADARQAQRLFPLWEIVRFLDSQVPWPYPEDGAWTYLRDRALPAMERGEEWHWSLRLKTDPGRLIGAVSLMKKENKNRAFWLGLPWHGQGLMSEAAEAVTDHWFDALGFPVLRVPKAVANTASRRISEKQGMRVAAVEERDYVGGRFLTEVWEISARGSGGNAGRRQAPAARRLGDGGREYAEQDSGRAGGETTPRASAEAFAWRIDVEVL